MSDKLSIFCDAEDGGCGVVVATAVRSSVVPALVKQFEFDRSVREHPFGGYEGVGKLAAVVVECTLNAAGDVEHRILPK